MATVVIDLGERWSVEDEEDRPARAGAVRRPVAYLIAFVVAVLLTGAAPDRPMFEPLAEIPAVQFQAVQLGDGAVYVAGPAGARENAGVVAAYGLPGGSRRWVATLAGAPGDLRYAAEARVLVATQHDNVTGRDTVTALDSGTGDRLWSAPFDLVEAPAGTTGGLLERDPGAAGMDLRWVDLRTGRIVWSRHLPERSGFTVVRRGPAGGTARQVLLTGPDGLAELVDEQSGAVLASGPLGALDQLGGDPDGPRQATVSVVGDRVLVLRPPALDRPASLSAYGLDQLTPQWTVTGNFDGYPDACGPVICLDGGYRLTAVDPATGAVMWGTTDWQGTMLLDADHVVAFPQRAGAPMGVLDLRTGRTVMTVRGWQLVTDLSSSTIGLLVAPDVRSYGHYWFGVPDLRRGEVRPLGYVPGVMSQDCEVGGDLLLCRTLDRTVQIWRYRT